MCLFFWGCSVFPNKSLPVSCLEPISQALVELREGRVRWVFFFFEDFSLVIFSLSLCLPLTPCYHTCVSKVAFFSHSHVFYALLPGWTVHCCMGWEKALDSNPGLWTSFLWSALCFNPAHHWTWGSSCEPLRVMKRSTYLPLASFIQTLEVVALLHLHWNLSLVAVTSFVFSLIASLLI